MRYTIKDLNKKMRTAGERKPSMPSPKIYKDKKKAARRDACRRNVKEWSYV